MSAPIVTGCGLPVFGTETCEGQVITYDSAQMTVECPVGYYGGPFTSVLGKFTSTISQADADAKAEAYLANLLASACSAPPPPVVSPGSITVGIDLAISYQIVATNNPASYGATLPSWLSINPTTGLITGTAPNTRSITDIPLSATNAGGTGTGTLVVTVKPYMSIVFQAPTTSGSGTATSSTMISIDGATPIAAVPTSTYLFLNQLVISVAAQLTGTSATSGEVISQQWQVTATGSPTIKSSSSNIGSLVLNSGAVAGGDIYLFADQGGILGQYNCNTGGALPQNCSASGSSNVTMTNGQTTTDAEWYAGATFNFAAGSANFQSTTTFNLA